MLLRFLLIILAKDLEFQAHSPIRMNRAISYLEFSKIGKESAQRIEENHIQAIFFGFVGD
jgi:hypothetical protein